MMKDLLAKLEAAPEGSRELDAEIEVLLPSNMKNGTKHLPTKQDKCEPGTYWHKLTGATALWTASLFTTSLDVKVPGENIIEMLLYPETGLYWALHDGPTGRFGGTGHTEVLARRVAGLKGMETK